MSRPTHELVEGLVSSMPEHNPGSDKQVRYCAACGDRSGFDGERGQHPWKLVLAYSELSEGSEPIWSCPREECLAAIRILVHDFLETKHGMMVVINSTIGR